MEEIAARVAVVTGAGSGIGRGIAHALAGAGARVVVTDIEADAARTVADELIQRGTDAVAFQLDVTDHVAVEALAERVEAEVGPTAILCNNAGVLIEGSLVESTPEDWQWVLSVNVLGVMNGVRAFVPRMRGHEGDRHIVNTASMAGLAPRLDGRLGIYSASKAAAVVIGEMLREELAPDGIGVSVLCPATVRTRFWEAARNRPPDLGPGQMIPMPERALQAIDPMVVGEQVLAGIRENRPFIYTSDDVVDRVEERVARLLDGFDRA